MAEQVFIKFLTGEEFIKLKGSPEFKKLSPKLRSRCRYPIRLATSFSTLFGEKIDVYVDHENFTITYRGTAFILPKPPIKDNLPRQSPNEKAAQEFLAACPEIVEAI
jgi:hypothetical protein